MSKKKTTDYEEDILTFDLDDLTNALNKNVVEDVKTFEDIINLDGCLKREISLGDINPGTGVSIEAYIHFWNRYDELNNIPIEERQPIKIYIDSCGGSLTDSFTIIDAIKLSKTPVWTINMGCAYSGGFFIFISGHKRIAYPHSSFLFHEGSTSSGGTAGQFANYAQFYKKQLDCLKDIVLKNSNISEEEYQDIRKDDIWYDAQEGLEKEFVDEIAESFI